MPSLTITSLSELPAVAQAILGAYPNKKILLFNGQMGAGKTTLIGAICKELKVQDEISSPTFSIVNEYLSENGPVYHFDFYRLASEAEAHDMGAEEYFFSGDYCLIEWPNIVSNLLPSKHECISIDIFVNQDQRTITF